MSGSLHTALYDRFRELLTKARKQAGVTQVELSIKLKHPQSFVSKYERGERRVDVVEFLQICAALKIPPDTILNVLKKALK